MVEVMVCVQVYDERGEGRGLTLYRMTPMERRTINRNVRSILDVYYIWILAPDSIPTRTPESTSFEDSHIRVCTRVFMSESVEKKKYGHGIDVRGGGAEPC